MSSGKELKKQMVREFSGVNAQKLYLKAAGEGLWLSEKHFIRKYFTNRAARVIDLGCGTGRTTIPLHEAEYKVIGVDIVPAMIQNAKKIAKARKFKIDYRVGDATHLKFKNETFDYVLFSNQGWTHIPGREERLKALREIYRVMKKGGTFIFTAHQRVWSREFFTFWLKQWFNFYIARPLGGRVDELEFGDRFFEKDSFDTRRTFKTRQYIHVPTVGEVEREIAKAGFALLETNGEMQISSAYHIKHPPVFYICQK